MFSNSIKLFDILGFKIKLDPSWFLIAALIVWSLSDGYFPQTVQGLTRGSYILLAILAMLGLFACLILHELAHSLVARRFGLGIGGITLFLFGGVAELEHEPASPLSEFYIAIAGPIMSLVLALAAGATYAIAEQADEPGSVAAVLGYLTVINLILAAFNLLPAFPLDGGRVLRAYLWLRFGNLLKATRIASLVGVYIGYLLVGFGLLLLITGSAGFGGLWQVLIGLFLLNAAQSSYQHVLTKLAFKGRTVAAVMTTSVHTTTPDERLDKLVDEVMLTHGLSFVPVVEHGQLLGYIDTGVLRKIDRDNWATTHVDDVFVALTGENVISADLPLKDLMQVAAKSSRHKFLVAKGTQLLGVVTLADLFSYLEVVQDLGGVKDNAAPGL